MDVTPQSIRAVQFREKLRGYHPDDVDAFVAAVAKGVEDLEARLKVAESRVAEVEARQTGATEAEESLRRTLVLAQRTADAAIQEAREEAARVAAETAEQRAAAEAELATIRERLNAEAEQERASVREQLLAERTALQADIAALTAHLERERERLRIYFTDQLRRVDEGEPGIAAPPAMQTADAAPAPVTAEPAVTGDAPSGEAAATTTTGDVAPTDDSRAVGEAAAGAASGEDEDPFLAELRRAVNDDKPLGPREDEPPAPGATGNDETDDDGFDLFAKSDDDEGRFGSRRRFRR